MAENVGTLESQVVQQAYRRDYENLSLKYGRGDDDEFPQLGIPSRQPGPPQISIAG